MSANLQTACQIWTATSPTDIAGDIARLGIDEAAQYNLDLARGAAQADPRFQPLVEAGDEEALAAMKAAMAPETRYKAIAHGEDIWREFEASSFEEVWDKVQKIFFFPGSDWWEGDVEITVRNIETGEEWSKTFED